MSDLPDNWERVIDLARRHHYGDVADAMAEIQLARRAESDEWEAL